MTVAFRTLALDDVMAATALWHVCELIRPWNDPAADARRALIGPTSTIIASYVAERLIATAMCGWDGHRGWIYYLAVDPDFRRWGVGRSLVQRCEDWLTRFDAPKIQLMVRPENKAACSFYDALGYDEDEFRLFYRRTRAKVYSDQQSEAP